MNRLYDWLDIRPEEARVLWLSFTGAFLVVGYMVLARSLREALYLDAFDVKTLPYITAGVVLLGFFAAGVFSYFLAKFRAQNVLKAVTIISIGGLALFWPVATLHPFIIVLFYLWTALATILLTAGLWIVIAEHVPLRGGKRLYGLISAGGTAGAMIIGTSLKPLSERLPIWQMMPILIALLGLLFLCLLVFPKKRHETKSKPRERVSFREEVRLVLKSRHLTAIALLVVTATFASQLLDFQFKELVKLKLENKTAMAGFFGQFYGFTGAAALFVQVFLASRMLTRLGVGWSLVVLPLILIVGSIGLILVPSFFLVTAVRGSDNSLRKSLHRSVMEVLYLPVPSLLRRKTKTFIDSVLDATSEGAAALVIFFIVTLGNLPSRILSFLILASAGVFLWQARKMHRQYFDTLVERLTEKEDEAENFEVEEMGGYGQDLLDASYSSVNLQESLKKRGIVFDSRRPRAAQAAPAASQAQPSRCSEEDIQQLLQNNGPWNQSHIPALARMLVRDTLHGQSARALASMGAVCLDPLAKLFMDENMDFILRRRIPKILSKIEDPRAEEILLKGLMINRFEIRYRAAIALLRRREAGLPGIEPEKSAEMVWEAIRREVKHDRPVWEMQKILDTLEEDESDEFIQKQLDIRGELSLEHVFRMLALVHEPRLVRIVYQGLFVKDGNIRSFALEYLEHILPNDIQDKLWPFIGDVSERQKDRSIRPVDEVAKDLAKAGMTLFADKETKQKLMEAVENSKEEEKISARGD